MEDTHSTNGRNLERKKNTKTQFANLHRVQIYKYTHRNYNWRTQQRKKMEVTVRQKSKQNS